MVVFLLLKEEGDPCKLRKGFEAKDWSVLACLRPPMISIKWTQMFLSSRLGFTTIKKPPKPKNFLSKLEVIYKERHDRFKDFPCSHSSPILLPALFLHFCMNLPLSIQGLCPLYEASCWSFLVCCIL